MSATQIVRAARTDFVEALRLISFPRSQAGPATLRVRSALATLERAGQCQEIPVEGNAAFEAQFDLDFDKLAHLLPVDDPLELGFDGTHISFSRYRHPAMCPSTEDPLDAIAEKEKRGRIVRAAQMLEPYFIKPEELEKVCGTHSLFSEVEQPLTERIAKAWAELAPYGVSPDNLKVLISEKLKNAWRR